MKPKLSFRAAISDLQLLGTALGGPSWKTWGALFIGAFGGELKPAERKIFKEVTGREREPGRQVEELWAIVGRRGGKSRGTATAAAYIAGLCDHSDTLAPGETGVLLIIAPDQRQAAVCLNYISALFEATPMMRQLMASKTADSITLRNRVKIEVRAASFRTLRGPTYIAVIADEAAFWHSDNSANPDTEILAAVRPGLATTGGPLIVISSPYARRGEIYETYRRHYRAEGDPLILVAQGPSRKFNPTLPQRVVDRAIERDPASASAEYLAQFRTDIKSFVPREVVGSCIDAGVFERVPEYCNRYFAFCDPSGGSADSFTLAVAHKSKGLVIVDAVRETKPPFSPEQVVVEFCETLKRFKVSKVLGDHYGGEWPREQFRKHGIDYEPASKSKSELYRDLLPALNSQQVRLLDNPRLLQQLVSLERRTARSGKDTIEHPPNAHDDLANAVAGVVSTMTAQIGTYDTSLNWVGDDNTYGKFTFGDYLFGLRLRGQI